MRLKQAWHDMAATPRQIQCLMLASTKTPQTWHDAALKMPRQIQCQMAALTRLKA
jgi:hypothetical protein